MTILVYCVRCRRPIHQQPKGVWRPRMVGEPELCTGVLDGKPKRCKPGRVTNTMAVPPDWVTAHEQATL